MQQQDDDILEIDGNQPGEGGEIVIDHKDTGGGDQQQSKPAQPDPHSLKPFSDKFIKNIEDINNDN
jgi:hypothetical protein